MALKTLKAPKINKNEKKVVIDDSQWDNRPTISFSEAELPELKDWMLNGKYRLEVEVEMTGTRIEDYGSNKGKATGTFRVTKIGVDATKE